MSEKHTAKTIPPEAEVFDEARALRTMAGQVAAMYDHLPDLIETVKAVVSQQREHERRIIRLEGIAEKLKAATGVTE